MIYTKLEFLKTTLHNYYKAEDLRNNYNLLIYS